MAQVNAGQESTGNVESRVSKPTNLVNVLGQTLKNLPHALAFFQFMLVFLPFGFCSLTGIAIPYSNEEFIGALMLLLIGSGPALAGIAFVLMKVQRKIEPKVIKTYLLPIAGYASAGINIALFFIERDGWISDLVPMIVYFIGVLVTGTLAMLGLTSRQEEEGRKTLVPGLDLVLAIAVIGFLYLLPATFGLQALSLVGIIITLAIPPLLAVDTTRMDGEMLPAAPETTKPARFAWCDKFLSTGNGPRNWMGTAIMLLLSLAFGNFFAAVFSLGRPFPMYEVQAISFFMAMAASVLAFMLIYKERDATILFIVVIACIVVTMVLGDYVSGFTNNPVSLVISGVAAGGGLTLFFKFQDVRKPSTNLKDYSGNRTIEAFYYMLIAALLGLIFSFTISWEGLLREPVPGYLPARLILGGLALGFTIIILSVFTANSRYLTDVERGVVSKKATSMEELVAGGSKGGARKDDAMVSALLGGGGGGSSPKKVKPKEPGTDKNIAEASEVGAPKQPVIAKPVSPGKSELDGVRKVRALLLLSKRVQIDAVRGALGLDAGTCDIVLDIWVKELGIEVTGGHVDFKDIEISKVIEVLEAFLAEWNKSEPAPGSA